MTKKRVLLIDEESAFMRYLQDDLERREIAVACVYSPLDENGAAAFAPDAIVADKKMLAKTPDDFLHKFDNKGHGLPLVLMTTADPGPPSGWEAPMRPGNSQIIATIPKPFETDALARLINRHIGHSEKTIPDSQYIEALVASDRLIENLVVEIQSKHSLIDGRIVGYEALSRLKTRRAVSPATIFSSATEIALEIEATLNVVDQVVKLAKLLRGLRKAVPVSFNCSAILLTQSEFVDALRVRLEPARDLDGSVIMEITEEDRIADIQTVSEICRILSDYGLTTSIDDFGTGLSNLDRIADIPFGELKIDKEIFWAYCNDRVPITVLGSIIDFCHMRKAKSVVEGIETPFHLEKARLLGADYGQGFYWGHAIPPQYLVKDWQGP